MTDVGVYAWDSVPAEDRSGVRRSIAGSGATLKRIAIKAGTRADRHSHPFEQFVQVLEGAGRLECEAGAVDLRPGMVVHFPPDAWHSAVFETDTVLVEINLHPAEAKP
ncbi:MAG TPA: cupin domain-containing protein [Stellaceae bacterium]|jgi:quercetin dioxygenase-like cupin family protein